MNASTPLSLVFLSFSSRLIAETEIKEKKKKCGQIGRRCYRPAPVKGFCKKGHLEEVAKGYVRGSVDIPNLSLRDRAAMFGCSPSTVWRHDLAVKEGGPAAMVTLEAGRVERKHEPSPKMMARRAVL
jgi:hypothetical protein